MQKRKRADILALALSWLLCFVAFGQASAAPVSVKHHARRQSPALASTAKPPLVDRNERIVQIEQRILKRSKPAAGSEPRMSLELSNKALATILASLKSRNSLYVTDAFNLPALKGAGLGKVVLARDNRLEWMAGAIADRKFDRVVAVGGCVALDAGRVLAADRGPLTVIPFLSTACISTNKAIIRSRGKKKRVFGQEPEMTIVSQPYVLSGDTDTRSRWLGSAYGDLFGMIGAALDVTRQRGSQSTGAALQLASDAHRTLSWVEKSFAGFGDPQSVNLLARSIHQANRDVIRSGISQLAGGGEHKLYDFMVDKYDKHYRTGGATHGQIVAVGTLLAAKQHALSTGDATLFKRLQGVYRQLGLPTTQAELAAMGVNSKHLVDGLIHVARTHPETVLGSISAGNGKEAKALVKLTFGDL